MIDNLAILLSVGFLLLFTFVVYLRRAHPEPHMDWEDLDLTSIIVPDGFHWGVATAAHQIEGGLRNNWTTFETSSGMEQSGQACDHWNLWKQDFQLISDLGLTTYRFSIEWSRLEPEQGVWEEEPLHEYSRMVDDLLSKGIRPMITLHHFSHPDWWEEKEGSPRLRTYPNS